MWKKIIYKDGVDLRASYGAKLEDGYLLATQEGILIRLDQSGNIIWAKGLDFSDENASLWNFRCSLLGDDILVFGRYDFSYNKSDGIVGILDASGTISDCNYIRSYKLNEASVDIDIEAFEDADNLFKQDIEVDPDDIEDIQLTLISSDRPILTDLCASVEAHNQPPMIDSFSVQPTSGSAPLKVTFTCVSHDPDLSLIHI